MKDIILNTIAFLVGAALFGPTVVGVIDATWFFYTNHTLTAVEWTEGRVWFAVGMPILGGMLASLATI